MDGTNAAIAPRGADIVCLGVGPGEPGLVSAKATALMDAAELAFAPVARNGENSLAASIALAAGLDGKKLVPIVFPMERDAATLEAAWLAAAAPVREALDSGRRCVFLTLGDPALYSTWTYLKRALEKLRPGTTFGSVPCVMAANAAAALLGRPLAEGSERLALLPLPEPAVNLDAYLPLVERLVVYKIADRLPELAAWVRSRGLGGGADLVVAAGLPGRERSGPLLELAEEANGYLSLAIIDTKKRGKGRTVAEGSS